MSSLYVDRRDVTLKADGEALVFFENGARIGTVPLAPLERVFLRGDVTLSSSLLGKLGARGIGVVVLSGRKAEPTLLLARPHNDAARRMQQYRLAQAPVFCLETARWLVARKFAAQRAFLEGWRERELRSRYLITVALRRLEGSAQALPNQNALGGLRGLEGAGTAAYFEGFGDLVPEGLGFHRRNRRPPRDPMNAVLSLGYTLLHAEATLALHGAGFDPYIGFYHALDFGRESLSCDLVEPLRTEVDHHALELFRGGTLRAEDFSSAEGACLLGKAGRSRYYAAWEPVAERLRKALNELTHELAQRVGVAEASSEGADAH